MDTTDDNRVSFPAPKPTNDTNQIDSGRINQPLQNIPVPVPAADRNTAISNETNRVPGTIATTDKVDTIRTHGRWNLPKKPFKCQHCGFCMFYQYKGTNPPFAEHVKFNSPVYLVLDPSVPPPTRSTDYRYMKHFLKLGSDCFNCNKTVCVYNRCSIFYGRYYCAACACKLYKQFPLDVQRRIRAFLVNKDK